MTGAYHRPSSPDRDDSDEWLLEAARRARHPVPAGERPSGVTAWRVLLSAGLADAEVLRLACAGSGSQPADFAHVSPALIGLLPHGVALKHRVAPLGVHDGVLGVATANPRSPALEKALAFAAKQRVRLFAASPSDILAAQARVYGQLYGAGVEFGGSGTVGAPAPPPPPPPPPRAPIARLSVAMPQADEPPDARVAPSVRQSVERGRQSAATPSAPSVPVAATPPARASGSRPVAVPGAAPAPPAESELLDRLLNVAAAEAASEAIIEPAPDGGMLVRLRIDGAVIDRFRIAGAQVPRVLEALKARHGIVDGGADAAVRTGRSTHESAQGPVTVRLTVLRIGDGRERFVLRLFAPADLRALSDLGIAPESCHRVLQLLKAASGLLICAGPAGSGVTTSLYAVAATVRDRGRTVRTVEDPVEYPLPRVDQRPVGRDAGDSLASTVAAAMTGPEAVLVIAAPLDEATLAQCLSEKGRTRFTIGTLRTPTVAASVARLLALSPDAGGLAAALRGVMVQRLLRRLCDACAAPLAVGELPELQQRLLYGLPAAKLRRPVGCPACRNTGYRGRTAIAAVVEVNATLAEAVTRGVTEAEFAGVARAEGMTTIWDAGIRRVLDGVTSLAELLDHATPPATGESAAPQQDIDALLSQLLGSPQMQPGAAPARAEGAATASVSADAAPAARMPRMSAQHEQSALPRLLLVDDDPAARRRLAAELTAEGFIVIEVADGDAALAYAKRLRPDLILTEVALPKLDATGLLDALASYGRAPPVVVCTAQTDDALHAWLRDAGARDILSRDLPVRELAERLRAIHTASD